MNTYIRRAARCVITLDTPWLLEVISERGLHVAYTPYNRCIAMGQPRAEKNSPIKTKDKTVGIAGVHGPPQCLQIHEQAIDKG